MIVVARIVEPILLVSHPPERQTRQVAHLEERVATEQGREPGGLLRVSDLAEMLLASGQLLLIDLDQASAIVGLRPEARAWVDLGICLKRLGVAPHALPEHAVQVGNVSCPGLFRTRGEASERSQDLLRLAAGQ